MQVGGGVNADNALEWIEKGASHVSTHVWSLERQPTNKAIQVILTSYLFPDAQFSLERLKAIANLVGRERVVIDLRYVLGKPKSAKILTLPAAGDRVTAGLWQ